MRPLRADAERSVRAILEAAEAVLAEDPAASMEQIAEVAGVARTTVHRRFASRQALLGALAESAQQQLSSAIDDAFPESAPVMVVLHRVTANVIRVKSAWRFTLSSAMSSSPVAAQLWASTDSRCLAMMERARDEGVLAADIDPDWMRQVFYALVGIAMEMSDDSDELAGLVVRTLLHGGGELTA